MDITQEEAQSLYEAVDAAIQFIDEGDLQEARKFLANAYVPILQRLET